MGYCFQYKNLCQMFACWFICLFVSRNILQTKLTNTHTSFVWHLFTCTIIGTAAVPRMLFPSFSFFLSVNLFLKQINRVAFLNNFTHFANTHTTFQTEFQSDWKEHATKIIVSCCYRPGRSHHWLDSMANRLHSFAVCLSFLIIQSQFRSAF